jgi:8-oxo-dGTP diphosphatase
MTLSTLTVVAAALINPQNELLLSCRPEGKMMAGFWEFPGGKIEPFESPEQALARELLEEIGIHTTAENMVPAHFASHAYESFHLLMPLFLIRHWTGTPTPLEGQTLQWLPLDQINTALMPPPDGPLVDRIKELVDKGTKAF